MYKVNRGPSLENQDAVTNAKEWHDIREGIKLRNIVQSKRLGEVSLLSPGMENTKLIIQRHLGHKSIIPGSSQWVILEDSKDECWI